MDDEWRIVPIGRIHTPYETREDAPHQGFAADVKAELEVFDTYTDALSGIEDVLRLTVLYWAHEADRSASVGDDGTGAFARRGPDRPNPLSLCTCTVHEVKGQRIHVRGIDAVDSSPLIDLKPALQVER